MSGVLVATIRQRVAAALATVTGWAESGHPPDRFGKDSNQLQHKGFAVAVPTTTVDERTQRRSTGTVSSTVVEINWSYRLRADSVVEDTDLALAAEASLIDAVFSTEMVRTGISSVTLTDATRSSTVEGTYLVGRTRLRLVHRLDLLAP